MLIKVNSLSFPDFLSRNHCFSGFVSLLSQLTKVGDVTKEMFLSKTNRLFNRYMCITLKHL